MPMPAKPTNAEEAAIAAAVSTLLRQASPDRRATVAMSLLAHAVAGLCIAPNAGNEVAAELAYRMADEAVARAARGSAS